MARYGLAYLLRREHDAHVRDERRQDTFQMFIIPLIMKIFYNDQLDEIIKLHRDEDGELTADVFEMLAEFDDDEQESEPPEASAERIPEQKSPAPRTNTKRTENDWDAILIDADEYGVAEAALKHNVAMQAIYGERSRRKKLRSSDA
jgi:hypothetical protein